MKDLKKIILQAGKKAQKVARGELNFGGCCVYAALVARELVKRGHPARGVAYAGFFGDNHANLDEVRNKLRDPKSVWAWNKRGVNFSHVAVEAEIGGEIVVFDSDGFRPSTPDMYEGRLTVEELGTPLLTGTSFPIYGKRCSTTSTRETNDMRIPARYHKIDGWRGFWIPGRAIAGASDTGMAPDSPAPSDEVKAEIDRFRSAMREAGIRTRTRWGTSSNVFMAKRWVSVVNPEELPRATTLAKEWLEDHRYDTRYIHDAV